MTDKMLKRKELAMMLTILEELQRRRVPRYGARNEVLEEIVTAAWAVHASAAHFTKPEDHYRVSMESMDALDIALSNAALKRLSQRKGAKRRK